MDDPSKLELRVADGDITAVLVDGSCVTVVIRTWDEKTLSLHFFKAVDVRTRCEEFRSDLSHIEVAPSREGEATNIEPTRLFRFMTAMDNVCVVEIEAEDQEPRLM